MKKYKFEIIITEGNDEFWEEIGEKSGCDEVTDVLKNLLYDGGWEPSITLVEYKNGN